MELEEIRKEIDKIDDGLLSLLAKRKSLAKEIAMIKKSKNMPILDKKREIWLIQRLKRKAKELGLDEEFTIKLYQHILENSKKEQEKV